jgi:hypothetical protein
MNYKENCLAALKIFIEESSNENKLELYLAYEEIEDESQRENELGKELNAAFCTILYQNHHNDAFLAELKNKHF